MEHDSISKKAIRKLTWKECWILIRDTFVQFFQENSFFHGAALSYYTVFAMVPIIYLSLISFGQIVGQQSMLDIIEHMLKAQMGIEDSSGIMSFFATVNFEKGSVLLNIVGVFALLLSSSALLTTLRTSINEFYDINISLQNKKARIKHAVFTKLVSMLMLAVFAGAVISLYIGETILLSLSSYLYDILGISGHFLSKVLEHVMAILMNTILFAMVFKYIHDGKVLTRLALYGGLFTSVLLYLGQLLIKFYLKNYFFGSQAGVAGTILVILAWMYYSSQIIFLGAKFIKVYSDLVERPIVFYVHRFLGRTK